MNKEKIKVLIIEDDEDDYIIIKHYLTQIKRVDFDVYWCNNFDFAFEEIAKNEHDIYLIDQYLGSGEGVQLIEKLRKNYFIKPLILLTGAGNIKIDETAMEKGASDFLVKSEIRPDTIERALRYALDRYQQQSFIIEQEKKYRSLFELSMEPLVILNDHFDIIEFNHAFMQNFDNLEKDVLSSNLADLFKFDFDFLALKNKLSKHGFIRGFKTELKGVTGRSVAILSVAKLPGEENTKGAYQVVINDVSKLIEAQEEIQRMEKLSMTGRMARMIAHEVRNPLTNINLALGELSELTKHNSEATLYQDMIGRNAKRINTLIDELLKSAKPQNLQIVPAKMQSVLDDAIEFCKDRIELLGVNFSKSYPSEIIEGKWDTEKLKIAFSNVLINAIESMENIENPELKVLLINEDEKPTIVIKDNGKGMDEDTQSKLFDPFFTNRKDGLGLGLTATLNIISMHKGRISVKSKIGVGTEFKLML